MARMLDPAAISKLTSDLPTVHTEEKHALALVACSVRVRGARTSFARRRKKAHLPPAIQQAQISADTARVAGSRHLP